MASSAPARAPPRPSPPTRRRRPRGRHSALPSSTAARPTPPAAPSTSRVSPALSWPRSSKRVDRRGIGEDQGRAFLEAALGRQRERGRRGDDDLLGEPAMAEHGDQPVADGPAVDALAHRLDLAGDLAAGRERPRRLELIFVLDDQHVGIVDGAGADPGPATRPGPATDRHLVSCSVSGPPGSVRRWGKQRLHSFRGRGKAGSLAMSAGSCWMITLARVFAIAWKRSKRGQRVGAVGVEARHAAVRDLLGEVIKVAGQQHRPALQLHQQALMSLGVWPGMSRIARRSVAEHVLVALNRLDLRAASIQGVKRRLGRPRS